MSVNQLIFGSEGGQQMPSKDIQQLIIDLKKAKSEKEITYPRLIEMLENHGAPISLTTLRRVFANGSETNDSFNYASTLKPLEDVLLSSDEIPSQELNPYAQHIEGLKAVIHTQNEEIVRLHEIKEHLEQRITFLLEQIEKKDRRMDEKDEIIRQLMAKVLKEE